MLTKFTLINTYTNHRTATLCAHCAEALARGGWLTVITVNDTDIEDLFTAWENHRLGCTDCMLSDPEGNGQYFNFLGYTVEKCPTCFARNVELVWDPGTETDKDTNEDTVSSELTR
jgi:hypothetical protein